MTYMAPDFIIEINKSRKKRTYCVDRRIHASCKTIAREPFSQSYCDSSGVAECSGA